MTFYGPWHQVEGALTHELMRIPGTNGALGRRVKLTVLMFTDEDVKIEWGMGEPGYEVVMGRMYLSGTFDHKIKDIAVPPGPYSHGPLVVRVQGGMDAKVRVQAM